MRASCNGCCFFRESEELSAVCVFSLSDINKVMNGPFKELKKNSENWINPEPVPTPRPGQVLNHNTLINKNNSIIDLFLLLSMLYSV